jgi:hypothetical protein
MASRMDFAGNEAQIRGLAEARLYGPYVINLKRNHGMARTDESSRIQDAEALWLETRG